MTDRESAAGLVGILYHHATDLESQYRGTDAKLMCHAARSITTLLSELERVGKENIGLRGIVSKMTNALPSGAYCSPEASLEFMAHLPDEVLLCTSKLVADKAKAEALVAEAAGLIRRMASVRDPFQADASTKLMCAIVAARAFIEKAKS